MEKIGWAKAKKTPPKLQLGDIRPVADEKTLEALIAALRERRIWSAGLDVYADEPRVPAELVAMEQVVLLPHVGSATGPTRDAMARLVVDNLRAFARGEGPLTPVDETPWRG